MVKPIKKVREAFDFHQVIHHIEEKYKFDHRDFLNSHMTDYDITEKYNKDTGSNIDGNTLFTSPEYKAFLAWVKKKGIPNLVEEVPYLDFWHWLLHECFFDVTTGAMNHSPSSPPSISFKRLPIGSRRFSVTWRPSSARTPTRMDTSLFG